MTSSKKVDLARDSAAGVCLSFEALPLQGFVLGGVAILQVLNLVRYRVLNSCRIWSPTRLNTPPPSKPHTVYLYCTFDTGKRGRGEGELNQKEGQRGNSSQSWVENTNMTAVSPVYKHLPQGPFTGQFFWMTTFVFWCLYS